MSQPTVAVVIAKYIERRDLIASKVKEHKAEVAALTEYQKKCEKWLQGKMDELGASSLKADGFGSCYKERKESVKVTDFDAIFDFAVANNKRELFTKKVSSTVALEYMGEKRNQPLPPGLEYISFVDVKVRRA